MLINQISRNDNVFERGASHQLKKNHFEKSIFFVYIAVAVGALVVP